MYLSRLQLNPKNRQVWRQIIGNPYKTHQLVMRGFADGVKREDANILHRLDIQENAATLMVQSDVEPDWSTVKIDYLAPADPYDLLPNPAVKPLELTLQAGQILNFRLRANPSVKKIRRDENGEFRNSNRVPLVRGEQQLEWLQKRAAAGGFRIRHIVITQAQEQKAWKSNSKRPITLYTVQFDGVLQVSSPGKLLETIKKGVGPSKAFGCGLLSLAPG